MPQRDARLQTIQAEIDRCMSEVVFLGSGVGDKASTNRDILNKVSEEVSRIQIEGDNMLLRRLLDFIKPMLTTLISEIMQMDFKTDRDWGKLKNRLDVFSATLWTLVFTQNADLGALFSSIREGIVESKPSNVKWMNIPDREVHFRSILGNIGQKMKSQHSIFETALPRNVVGNIEKIENILIRHVERVAPVSQEGLNGGRSWKDDLEWVGIMITDMKLSGSPLEAMLNLVQPVMLSVLRTIRQLNFDNTESTRNLYRNIVELQMICKVLSEPRDLGPLFGAIQKGIESTIPVTPKIEQSMSNPTVSKRALGLCLRTIGQNICDAENAINGTALQPIAVRINSVGRRLRDINLGD
jgi:hypothetical protein